MKSSDILTAVIEKAKAPGWWCQGRGAITSDGVSVNPTSKAACHWCLAGIIQRVSDDLRVQHLMNYVFRWTRAAILNKNEPDATSGLIASWNDAPERVEADVEPVLAKALDLALAAGD